MEEASKRNLIDRDQNDNYTLTGLLPWSTYSVEVIAYNLFQGKRLESDASHDLVIQTLVSGKLSLRFDSHIPEIVHVVRLRARLHKHVW